MVRPCRYRLNVGILSETIETLLNGTVVSQVLEGRKRLDLFVRLNKRARNAGIIGQDTITLAQEWPSQSRGFLVALRSEKENKRG